MQKLSIHKKSDALSVSWRTSFSVATTKPDRKPISQASAAIRPIVSAFPSAIHTPHEREPRIPRAWASSGIQLDIRTIIKKIAACFVFMLSSTRGSPGGAACGLSTVSSAITTRSWIEGNYRYIWGATVYACGRDRSCVDNSGRRDRSCVDNSGYPQGCHRGLRRPPSALISAHVACMTLSNGLSRQCLSM